MSVLVRFLCFGLLSVVSALLIRVVMWLGASEPLAFISVVLTIIALALFERFMRKSWTDGAATGYACLFGPALVFPINDIYPNATTDRLILVGFFGMMFGICYVIWSFFKRPAKTY
jgi:hypothetical protein